MTKKRFLFLIDPIESFNPVSETTYWFMAEMHRRGHLVFGATLNDLFLQNSTVMARATQYSVVHANKFFSHKSLSTKMESLSRFDAVFLRKDPPVDLKFGDHLSLLELARSQTQLVNDPTGIKQANEKIFPHRFKNFSPKTLVSCDHNILKDFVSRVGTAVIKPLNLSGGREIIIVNKKDASLNSLLSLSTSNQARYVMAQEFLPEAQKGDKRVLILGDRILGCFLRVPGKSDFRGNLHSGAKLKSAKLTKSDHEKINSLLPSLKNMGLHFVGLDFLGEYITEINVTSPMGIGELNSLYNAQADKIFVDWVENLVG